MKTNNEYKTDIKIAHHVCGQCGWGSSVSICKRCGTEYKVLAPIVVTTEKPVVSVKTDDMSWFVF